MRFLLALAALVGAVAALPPLKPCPEAAGGGRWGLCATAAAAGGGARSRAPTPVVLRGSNYIRLGGPGLSGYHSTFDEGVYNRTRYNNAFTAMKTSGYNIARVFIDELPGRGIGGPTNATAPLDAAWVDRLAEFISDAEKYGLYTLVTIVYVPDNAWFRKIASAFPPNPAEWNGSWNTNFLTASGHAAYAAYSSQLALGLSTRLAPAAQDAVLVSLQNEFFLNGDQYPFSDHAATVKLADGVEYSMAEAAARQQAADANTNLWASRLRSAIRAHLPATLVTTGVFTFQAVNKNGPNGLLQDGCSPGHPGTVDCRFPARPMWLAKSGMDFLDVHIYQADGSPAALAANLETEEWDEVTPEVPVVMGEFGCNVHWWPNATACKPHVRQLQISSCEKGFTSWLFWTYDTHPNQPDWFDMVTDDDGAINAVLAPAGRPDPCAA